MTDSLPRRDLRRGLTLMAFAVGGQAMFMLLRNIVSIVTISMFRARLPPLDFVVWSTLGLAESLLDALLVVGILRYRRGNEERTTRSLLVVAAGLLAAFTAWCVLLDVGELVASALRRRLMVLSWLGLGSLRWVTVVEVSFHFVGVVLLVAALVRARQRINRRLVWLPLALVGVALTTRLVQAFGLEIVHASGISVARPVVSALLGLLEAGGMIWVILAQRRALSVVGAMQPATDPALEPEFAPLSPVWERAGRGLALYRTGILLQLAGGILGVVVVRAAACGPTSDFASASATIESVKSALVFSALLGLALGLVPLVGLVRYAGIPEESGGRGSAVFGLVCALSCLIGALISCGLVLQATRSSSLWALHDLEKQLPFVEGPTYLVGFAGVLALLLSYSAVARFLALEAAARRARVAAGAVPFLGAAVVLVRLLVLQLAPALLLVLVLGILIGAVAFLVVYLQVIRTLVEAIRQRLVAR